jgi:hypothetical protein
VSISCPREEAVARVSKSDRVPNPRRVAANRANARKSTGPRTIEGKARSARNATKHGLCSSHTCLPSESEATFERFRTEIRDELQPRTVIQIQLFNQIANLLWRLNRVSEAQTKLFAAEEPKARHEHDDDTEDLAPCEILARRFSDDSTNGFILLDRYERGMRNAMLRLRRQYEYEKKHHPTIPYDDDEPPAPPQRAWPHPPGTLTGGAFVSKPVVTERSQSEPSGKPTGASQTQKSSSTDTRAVTKQSQVSPTQCAAPDEECGSPLLSFLKSMSDPAARSEIDRKIRESTESGAFDTPRRDDHSRAAKR